MIRNMIVYADCNIQQNKLAKNRRSILIFAKRFRKEHVLTISVSAFKCTSERSIMPAHTHTHTQSACHKASVASGCTFPQSWRSTRWKKLCFLLRKISLTPPSLRENQMLKNFHHLSWRFIHPFPNTPLTCTKNHH